MGSPNQVTLSEQFSEFIDPGNLKNPGSPTELEQVYILAALVEAFCMYNDTQETPLFWVPEEARANQQILGTRVLWRRPISGQHTWFSQKIGAMNPIGTYVDLYRHLYHCDFYGAVQKLAVECGLAPGLFLNTTGAPNKPSAFPLPGEISIDGSIYKKISGSIVFRASAGGGILQEILVYYAGNLVIHVPMHASGKLRTPNHLADAGQGQLAYGPGGGKLPLYNLDLIDSLKNPTATVFLCEDLQTAVILSAIIKDSKRLAPNHVQATELYVATSWYGGARLMEHVDFGPLWNKNIVYIPDISRISYKDIAKNVMDDCLRVRPPIKFFRVYRPAVLKYPPHYDADRVNAIEDPWERYLAKSAISLRDCESLMIQKMAEEAVTWDNYKKWGESVGLFPPSHTGEATGQVNYYTHTNTLSRLRANFPLAPDSGLGLDCFGAFENMTVLYGNMNSSKSMLALAVAVGRACGQGFLGFEALPPAKVLYVDGETSGPTFRERLERTMSAFRCNTELLEANLQVAPLYADHLIDSIDLENETQQNAIEKLIRQYRSELVIFDNLQCLLDGFRSNNATQTWKSFHGWLIRLEKQYSTGFLIIHHDNADGRTAGTSKIEWQLSTLIHVLGREALKNALDKTDHESDLKMYERYIDKNGALFRAKIKKTKFSSVVTSPFGGFLLNPGGPIERRIYGPPWGAIGHVIPSIARENLAADKKMLRDTVRSQYPDRTDDEYKVLEYLYVNRKIKVGDLRGLFALGGSEPCSASTARNRLKPLLAAGIVEMDGKACNTYYRLAESMNDEVGPAQSAVSEERGNGRLALDQEAEISEQDGILDYQK